MIRFAKARSKALAHRPPSSAAVMVEELENRWHRSDSISQSVLTHDYISEASGYLFWGAAMYGANGEPDGPAGVSIGDSNNTMAWGCNVWDDNLSDGFDTGEVTFSFLTDLRNTDYMEFETSYSDVFGAYNTASNNTEITMIEIRAAVEGAHMKVAFGSISASFYSNGVFQETITIGSGPSADRLNETTSGAKEQILQLDVDENEVNYDKVVITGTFRMQATQGTYPDADDLFVDIYVYAA